MQTVVVRNILKWILNIINVIPLALGELFPLSLNLEVEGFKLENINIELLKDICFDAIHKNRLKE